MYLTQTIVKINWNDSGSIRTAASDEGRIQITPDGGFRTTHAEGFEQGVPFFELNVGDTPDETNFTALYGVILPHQTVNRLVVA